MIRVKVELESAICRSRDKRIAEVLICNSGTGTALRGNYEAVALNMRSRHPQRFGCVDNHPRKSQHVLTLLRKSLEAMGY
jgi:hypothetical protein